MEILRFEEAPSDAPKRKKSSRSFLALGLVATLFGVSTAFATTTININANAPISLGQGVNVFTACDTKIGLEPVTSLKTDLTSFQLDKLKVGSPYLGDDTYKIDTHAPRTEAPDLGLGCGGVAFKVRFFKVSNTPLTCNKLFGDGDPLTPGAYKKAALAGKFSVSDGTGDYKCDASAIFFTIPIGEVDITEEMNFLAHPSPDFFDHVTIETTTTVDYDSLDTPFPDPA